MSSTRFQTIPLSSTPSSSDIIPSRFSRMTILPNSRTVSPSRREQRSPRRGDQLPKGLDGRLRILPKVGADEGKDGGIALRPASSNRGTGPRAAMRENISLEWELERGLGSNHPEFESDPCQSVRFLPRGLGVSLYPRLDLPNQSRFRENLVRIPCLGLVGEPLGIWISGQYIPRPLFG